MIPSAFAVQVDTAVPVICLCVFVMCLSVLPMEHLPLFKNEEFGVACLHLHSHKQVMMSTMACCFTRISTNEKRKENDKINCSIVAYALKIMLCLPLKSYILSMLLTWAWVNNMHTFLPPSS